MHHQIKTTFDFFLVRIQGHPTPRAHSQRGQTSDSLLRPAGMNGGQGPAMSCAHSVEQGSSFHAAHFAYDDSVGPVSQHCFEEVVEGEFIAMSV